MFFSPTLICGGDIEEGFGNGLEMGGDYSIDGDYSTVAKIHAATGRALIKLQQENFPSMEELN